MVDHRVDPQELEMIGRINTSQYNAEIKVGNLWERYVLNEVETKRTTGFLVT